MRAIQSPTNKLAAVDAPLVLARIAGDARKLLVDVDNADVVGRVGASKPEIAVAKQDVQAQSSLAERALSAEFLESDHTQGQSKLRYRAEKVCPTPVGDKHLTGCGLC